MKHHLSSALRQRSETDYAALKLASKRLVKACGGLESAALITRVGHSELARYYDPAEKLYLPIDIAADLETDCGNPLVTAVLAKLAGHEMTPMVEQITDTEALRHWPVLLASLGAETAGFLAQMGNAISQHGTLSSEGIGNYRLAAHLDNLIQAAIRLRSLIASRQARSEGTRNGHASLP